MRRTLSLDTRRAAIDHLVVAERDIVKRSPAVRQCTHRRTSPQLACLVSDVRAAQRREGTGQARGIMAFLQGNVGPRYCVRQTTLRLVHMPQKESATCSFPLPACPPACPHLHPDPTRTHGPPAIAASLTSRRYWCTCPTSTRSSLGSWGQGYKGDVNTAKLRNKAEGTVYWYEACRAHASRFNSVTSLLPGRCLRTYLPYRCTFGTHRTCTEHTFAARVPVPCAQPWPSCPMLYLAVRVRWRPRWP